MSENDKLSSMNDIMFLMLKNEIYWCYIIFNERTFLFDTSFSIDVNFSIIMLIFCFRSNFSQIGVWKKYFRL